MGFDTYRLLNIVIFRNYNGWDMCRPFGAACLCAPYPGLAVGAIKFRPFGAVTNGKVTIKCGTQYLRTFKNRSCNLDRLLQVSHHPFVGPSVYDNTHILSGF